MKRWGQDSKQKAFRGVCPRYYATPPLKWGTEKEPAEEAGSTAQAGTPRGQSTSKATERTEDMATDHSI